MSEQTELKIASSESVALELAKDISYKEELDNDSSSYRKNFLDLYAECLAAAKGYRSN